MPHEDDYREDYKDIDSRKDKSNATWWILGILAVIGVLFLIPLAANRNIFNQTNNVTDNRQPGVQGVSDIADEDEFGPGSAELMDDIVNNPDKYEGQVVDVTAEVEEVLNDNSLTLEAPGLAPDKDLLVVTATSLKRDDSAGGDYLYNDDDVLRVSGTLVKFNRTDIENRLGIDINDDEYADFDGKPVIVANSVTRTVEE